MLVEPQLEAAKPLIAGMSETGQSLPVRAFWAMSDLPLVATELPTSLISSFVPVSDPCAGM